MPKSDQLAEILDTPRLNADGQSHSAFQLTLVSGQPRQVKYQIEVDFSPDDQLGNQDGSIPKYKRSKRNSTMLSRQQFEMQSRPLNLNSELDCTEKLQKVLPDSSFYIIKPNTPYCWICKEVYDNSVEGYIHHYEHGSHRRKCERNPITKCLADLIEHSNSRNRRRPSISSYEAEDIVHALPMKKKHFDFSTEESAVQPRSWKSSRFQRPIRVNPY